MAMVAACPAMAQRRAVLPQIDEPHPYYYRELYLPQLTSGPSSLGWGPGSEELVYSMAGALWRQRLDSTEARQLTDGAGYDYEPDWSPDGKSVVYVSYQKDAMELWLLDLGTGKSRQLTSAGAVNVEPRWSPDGKKLVWVSTQYHGRFHIFAGEIENGALKNVARLTGETKSSLPRYYYSAYDMEINPTWMRDGKEILFVSNRGHIHGTGGFWRMKAEAGAEAHEIHYEETNWKARPEISPDGSRMVYSSYLGGQWHNVWAMPAGGGDAFPISYGDWDETNARWSPDGKKVAFISNKDGSTEIDWQEVSGGARRKLEVNHRVSIRPQKELWISTDGPVRISVTDEAGRSYAPENAWIFADDGFDRRERPFETHYFYSSPDGATELEVPLGQYFVEVSRGTNFTFSREKVNVTGERTASVHSVLEALRFESDGAGRWLACDLHVHMNYGGTYRNDRAKLAEQGKAEGLQIINELTVNKEQRFPDIQFREFDRTKTYNPDVLIVEGQEFHTSYWGHRGILGLQDHLLLPGYAGYPNTAAASLYPMSMTWRMSRERSWGRCIRLMRCRTRFGSRPRESRMNCRWMWRWGNWITWRLWDSATTKRRRKSGTNC
jgi:Tol biopolymer transport system component